MNIVDKVIGAISPQAGLKRAEARLRTKIINSGYGNHGANLVKKSMIGWDYHSGSPERDITDHISVLRQRSRDLYYGGAPIATGAIKTLRTNVVGSGLRLKPQIDAGYLGLSDEEASALEETIEREFLYWSESKNCDAQRMNTFYELQQLAFLSQMLSGEVFVLLPYIKGRGEYGLSILLKEADLVDTPMGKMTDKNISRGIEIGKYGEAKAYYFLNAYKDEITGEQGYTRVPAFGRLNEYPNVLHLMESERPSQARGVPVLAPVIESLKQLGRYTDAELMAAVVSAMYSLFITSEPETAGNTAFGESIPIEDQVDMGDENSYELGSGSILALAPGEKIQEANPNRPNTAFDGFVGALCRQVGSALEIPSELLLKQFDSSYSASRAALLEAWKMFKMRRKWLSTDFCQPIYEQWLAEAVSKGRINAPGFFADPLIRKAYTQSEWSGPSQGQIDPLKEALAAEKRVSFGFSTRQKETIELTGGDFVKNIRQRQKEEKLLKDLLGGEEEIAKEDKS